MMYMIILMFFININGGHALAQEAEGRPGSVKDPLDVSHIGSPKIYTIYNISIDKTARTSSRASRAALRSAQRMALDTLFRKIIREEDHETLPQLSDGQVAELVSGIEVANEKSSRVRYMADFTVHFSRDKIYNFLSEKQIPFAETLSNPASILTVLEQDGAAVLWEKNNDWRAAWLSYDTANNLVPIRVVVPSLANRLALTAGQVQLGDRQLLQDFADRQGLVKLYVMSARIKNDIVRQIKTLELSIYKLGDDDFSFTTTIDLDITTDDMSSLYDEAIKQATYWLDNEWKEKVMIHFGTSSHLKVQIQYDSSEDWFQIKKKLESISLIRKVTLKNFTIRAAGVEIEHSGDVEQIILTLDQENLILTEQMDTMATEENYPWVLTLKK
ncbi:MAG: hypothetical protein COB54_06590 [Alphaproteobacteria bacterium]|nr:MAG: hypothetical protein COB54_06590 [Alphaproteobacteria bacterium]